MDATANVDVGSVVYTSASKTAARNASHVGSVSVCTARVARNALAADPAASSVPAAPAARDAGPAASSSRAQAARDAGPAASSSRGPAARAVVVKNEYDDMKYPTLEQMAMNLEIARSQKHFDFEPVHKSMCTKCNIPVTSHDTRGVESEGLYYHDSCAKLCGMVVSKKA